MDDLEAVAVGDAHVAEGRAWDDLQVALDGNALGVETELLDHFGQRHASHHATRLTIDDHAGGIGHNKTPWARTCLDFARHERVGAR